MLDTGKSVGGACALGLVAREKLLELRRGFHGEGNREETSRARRCSHAL